MRAATMPFRHVGLTKKPTMWLIQHVSRMVPTIAKSTMLIQRVRRNPSLNLSLTDDGEEPAGEEVISFLEARACADRWNFRQKLNAVDFADCNRYRRRPRGEAPPPATFLE
eukprot:6812909-Karenia_brevis.AAC.1